MKILISLAHDRKSARQHIGAMRAPLSNVVMQLYLWGDTQTKHHWRKELATIIQEVQGSLDIKGGKLKKKDIVEMLESISTVTVLSKCYRGSLQDPDYESLVTVKDVPPDTHNVVELIKELANLVFTDLTKWEVADELIKLINSW